MANRGRQPGHSETTEDDKAFASMLEDAVANTIRVCFQKWNSLPDDAWETVINVMYQVGWISDYAAPYELRKRDRQDSSLKTAAARMVAISLIQSAVPAKALNEYIHQRGIPVEPYPPDYDHLGSRARTDWPPMTLEGYFATIHDQ